MTIQSLLRKLNEALQIFNPTDLQISKIGDHIKVRIEVRTSIIPIDLGPRKPLAVDLTIKFQEDQALEDLISELTDALSTELTNQIFNLTNA